MEEQRAQEISKGKQEALEPGHPKYFVYLSKAIFLVGLNKCITPSVLILMGVVFIFINVDDRTQDCLEQVAGGLLIYTWGVKCMGPIQESFATAVEGSSKQLIALMGSTIMIVIILAPLFYLSTEGHDFSTVDGGILFFGVMGSGQAVQCTDEGLPINATQQCQKPIATRPGLVHSQQCYGSEQADAPPSSTGPGALIPYFIGFALDAIMLVLVEPEKDLVDTYTSMRRSYKSVVKDLLVTPIAFALDNLLTGAGCASVVLAAAGGSKGVAVVYFIVFALCTAIGVCIAYTIRAFMELCNRRGFVNVGLWVKFAFLLGAGLSFLDNGTDLVKTGLTFWVGLGAAIGWLLFASELLDSDEAEEHEETNGNGTSSDAEVLDEKHRASEVAEELDEAHRRQRVQHQQFLDKPGGKVSMILKTPLSF